MKTRTENEHSGHDTIITKALIFFGALSVVSCFVSVFMSVVLRPPKLPHDPFSIVRSIFFAATFPGVPEYLNRERATP